MSPILLQILTVRRAVDDGWVDPEEEDMWGSFKNIGKKLLNFGGKPAESQQGKKIIW